MNAPHFIKYPRAGDIAFSMPAKPGFYSRGVAFFTASRWSHCFFLCADYAGMRSVLEADLKVQLVPFEIEYVEKQNDKYEIYRPIAARPESVSAACEYTFIAYAGATYGFFEIPWFAVRAILNKLFKVLLRGNFVKSGVICSELLVDYLKIIDTETFSKLSSDDTSPEDIYKVIKSRPDLFEYIGGRE